MYIFAITAFIQSAMPPRNRCKISVHAFAGAGGTRFLANYKIAEDIKSFTPLLTKIKKLLWHNCALVFRIKTKQGCDEHCAFKGWKWPVSLLIVVSGWQVVENLILHTSLPAGWQTTFLTLRQWTKTKSFLGILQIFQETRENARNRLSRRMNINKWCARITSQLQ